MKKTRREFLRMSGLAIAASQLGGPLLWMTGARRDFFLDSAWGAAGTAAAAGGSGGREKILVVIFQRGAMDGLSMVPPIGDSRYAELRPNIAIPGQGELAALRLDGHFGLHPELAPLQRFWRDRNLAFVHQVGSPDGTRSHFDAQDFMESGTPGNKNEETGFLNRALLELSGSGVSGLRSERASGEPSPLEAVAVQASLPRILHGRFPAVSMNSLREFAGPPAGRPNKELRGFEEMYQQAADQVFRGIGREVFGAVKTVRAAGGAEADDDNQAKYPKSGLANHLREVSRLIRARVGLRVSVTEIGGWDTHVNQGNGKGQLASRLKELGEALAAFAEDLGPRLEDVCVVTITEFGRTVKENGNRGTDHGHGSVMSLLGGGVRGGKVYGNWKDLRPGNLYEERDLPVTTDFRLVMSEVLRKQLGVRELGRVFPGFAQREAEWLGVLG